MKVKILTDFQICIYANDLHPFSSASACCVIQFFNSYIFLFLKTKFFLSIYNGVFKFNKMNSKSNVN